MRKYSRTYFNLHKISLFRSKQTRELVKLVLDFKNEGQLLEIGCGDGKILSKLYKNFKITAIDISSAAIRKARKRLPGQSNLRVLDIENQYLEGQYDIILCLNVLEHLKNPEAVILKIRDILKDDGVFIFSVPNNYSLGKVSTLIMNTFDRTHISTYKRKQWVELVKKSGLEPVQIRNGFLYKPFAREFTRHFATTMFMITRKSG
jgi:2-polyprenyl-3-methyl-5-hydroxy-6-metoxy-1,4-benzoquinol methylase